MSNRTESDHSLFRDGELQVACLGDGTVADDLHETARDRPLSLSVTTAAEHSELSPEADCLVVTDPTGFDPRADQLPAILYSRADPMELSRETLAAVETIVQRGRSDSADRLLDKIRLTVGRHSSKISETAVGSAVAVPPIAAFLVDGDGTVVWSNRDPEELFPAEPSGDGAETDSLYGRIVASLPEPSSSVADRDRAPTPEQTGRLLTVPREGDTHYYRHDSHSLPDGRRLELFEDVTDRNRRRRELTRYERIIQTVGAPICTLDRHGRIRHTNHQFAEQFGHSRSAATGRRLDLVLDSEQTERVETALDGLDGDDRSTVTLELQVQPSSGDTIPTECRLARLPPSDHHDSVAVAVFHDISRLKEREQRLSKFASVVSHDLRNPMDVALGRAEMLPKIADVDEQTESHLHDISHSLRRMERLIQDVLTLTRQRDDSVETEPVSLSTAAETAWETVATAESELRVETDRRIDADRSRLVRALENLFRNAIQHAGEDVIVTVEACEDGFRVTDDGPGIPDQSRTDIFEDGFTTAEEGTGLGLAIVREIAGAHDWTVSVEDGPTGGAQFVFTGVDPA